MHKLLFFIVFLLAGVITFAQDSYIMYETMYIKPKYGKIREFNEALAAHNKKFHTEGPNAVAMHRVANGSKAGQLVWVMGTLISHTRLKDGTLHRRSISGPGS